MYINIEKSEHCKIVCIINQKVQFEMILKYNLI